MAGNIYRQTRERLEKIVGRPITKAEFGKALGLGAADAARSVRSWEADGAKPPRGLAALGLNYLRQGLGDDLPLHMAGLLHDERFVHRCRWPRFVARVVAPGTELVDGEVSAPISDGGYRLVVGSWIDAPMFGLEPRVLVEEAAAWIASATRRYDRKPSEPPPSQDQAANEAQGEEEQVGA